MRFVSITGYVAVRGDGNDNVGEGRSEHSLWNGRVYSVLYDT